MFLLVQKWSRRHNPKAIVKGFDDELVVVDNSLFQEFHLKPVITTKDWTDANKWQRLNKRVLKINSKYYTPSNEFMHMDDSKAKDFANKKLDMFNSFDEFIDYVQSIHVIEINQDEWELSSYNCHKLSFD